MATPCKPHASGIVLTDASICATCQSVSRDRYLLMTKNGLRKPLLQDLETICSMTLSQNIRNYDSYVCKACRRKIASWKSHTLAASNIKEDILRSAAPAETVAQVKRGRSLDCDGAPLRTQTTPKQKRHKVTTPKSKEKGSIDSTPRRKITFTSTTPRQSQRRQLYTSPGLSTGTPSKNTRNSKDGKSTRLRKTIKFHSTSIANKTSSIISSLCNGSIRKAVRKLLLTESLQTQSSKGLADAVRIESRKVSKLKQLRCSDLTFNIKSALEEVKKSLPLLWTTLSSVCKKKTPLSKVLMTVGILVQAKNRTVNGLQHLIGMLMYQSQLQKEGYSFLNHLGITVSYRTVLNKLHVMATQVDDTAISWKHGLETNNAMKQSNSGNLDSQELAPTANVDHTYAISPQCVLDADEEPGFRFNIDNLDYEVKVRNMTSTHQNKSKHYVQLPLGIFDKNECKTNDIIEIMLHLQKYVPGVRSEDELESMEAREVVASSMRAVPLGGDQLTCERIRGAHMARLDGDTPEERLEGTFSMIEDFHEKMNFLQAIMDKMYTMSSAREGGTLSQLRNLINRRNVVADVRKDYHAVADFFDLATDVHVLVAIAEHLGMDSLDAKVKFPKRMHLKQEEEKYVYLKHVIGQIVDRFVYNRMSQSLQSIENDEANRNDTEQDYVYNYATGLMKYGLLRRVATMTTAAGDGERCMRNWRYSMLVFHTTHKTKYRLESFLLQAATKSLLSPRLSKQVIWNRFINLSGGEGNNLDGDYVMELLNRLAKKRIKTLGPNHTAQAVMMIGKTLMCTNDIEKHMLREMNLAPESRAHTKQSVSTDLGKMFDELKNRSKVLNFIPGRSHGHFDNFSNDIFSDIDAHLLHKWINGKKIEYSGGKWAF
ncbi:uncharacterized protein [Ptychodera flava]|uniref:uncharacterized protein n=1 Tax=Ptychodera flava TaxID=63121 RepID=UPI00396A633F